MNKFRSQSGFFRLNYSLFLVCLLVFVGIMYLFVANNLSTAGYSVNKLESRLTELQETNKKLEIEMARLKSAQHVEEKVREINLVPSGQVDYVNPNEFAYKQ